MNSVNLANKKLDKEINKADPTLFPMNGEQKRNNQSVQVMTKSGTGTQHPVFYFLVSCLHLIISPNLIKEPQREDTWSHVHANLKGPNFDTLTEFHT